MAQTTAALRVEVLEARVKNLVEANARLVVEREQMQVDMRFYKNTARELREALDREEQENVRLRLKLQALDLR